MGGKAAGPVTPGRGAAATGIAATSRRRAGALTGGGAGQAKASGSAECGDRRLDLRLGNVGGDDNLDHRTVGGWPDHDRLV